MNKAAIYNGRFVSKVICLALALVLVTGLFAAGAFAELGCGEKCCCHRDSTDMHHSKNKRISLSADPCGGNPMNPCDLETGQSSQLPEFLLSSVGGIQPNTIAPAVAITESLIYGHHSITHGLYPNISKKSLTAPIYLQNRALLI